MITALIVDDEPSAIERLAELLEQFPEVVVIGTASDVADAGRFLAGRTPDVVFLDVNMPDGTGFDVVPRVPDSCSVVFVTALSERALDAFRVGAVDYLRKPVDRDRLAVTIDRLLKRTAPGRLSPPEPPPAGAGPGVAAGAGAPGTVPIVPAGGRDAETVPLAEIAWVQASRNYSRVQLAGRRPLLVRRTMAEWDELLPAIAYGRLDRSLIVNVALIQATQWQSRHQSLIFFRGVVEPLPIGRAATLRLKSLLPR